jgi:hypothetical protein
MVSFAFGPKYQSTSSLNGTTRHPLIQRHRENEPRFIGGGCHVNPSAMRLRDLRGDMQAKTQPLSAVPDVAAEEWLEKPFHCRRRDWIAGVSHPKFERCRYLFWLRRAQAGRGIRG